MVKRYLKEMYKQQEQLNKQQERKFKHNFHQFIKMNQNKNKQNIKFKIYQKDLCCLKVNKLKMLFYLCKIFKNKIKFMKK